MRRTAGSDGCWQPLGIKVAFTPLGVVDRAHLHRPAFRRAHVQPVLEDLDTEFEEAAASLGASRWQTFRRVVLPTILPALLTGFALAFARAVGEYGSVIFIAGNMPMGSEITPLLIITKLEQYDYAGATAIAAVMLVSRSCCCWSSTAAERGAAASRNDRLIDDEDGDARRLRPARRRARRPAHRRIARVRWTVDRHRAGFSGAVSLAAARDGVRRGLRKGLGVYFGEPCEPDALSAIRLDALAAAIAVP